MELMFEEFTVKSYYSAIGATLGLFSAGKTIGIVVDSGEGGTHTVPVYEGYSCVHAINKLKFAGGEMTSYLRDLLDERGYSFTTPKEIDIVRDIKEKLCIVSEEPNQEIKNDESHYSSGDIYFELPDGNSILIKGERYKAAEGTF
jgi:Actin and related proteins